MQKPLLITLMWRAVISTPPLKLDELSHAFAEALDINEERARRVYVSMTAALGRTLKTERPHAVIFARGILLVVRNTLQFITASHHADDYLHYPINLLRATSMDLMVALGAAKNAVWAAPIDQ
jgi:hypothetical protein